MGMGKISKMPTASTNSGIRDKHQRGNIADFLKAKLKTGLRLFRAALSPKLAMSREFCNHP
jgi:predicted GIY-YIG superfamily endonuclease